MQMPVATPEITPASTPEGIASTAPRIINAVFWRSGSQIVAQLSMWASTFWVLRLLVPADYGLYAMTSGVMVLLGMLNGQSFAGALIRAPSITQRDIRQLFGLLILMNGAVALVQIAIAPLVAHYFGQPVVADMLRAQTLLYAANPLIVLPAALLAREMDFRRQAKVNLVAAAAGALTALGGALAGWGPWTLVFAPLAAVWSRAIGMTIAARLIVWPSFRLGGAGATIWFGGAMLASDLLWLVQTQADVAVGGRVLDPHALGVYTTSLFLAQIVTSKFIPPLNEVAFTAYARIQHDRGEIARSFEKSVRIIMMAALPFYFGLAVTAAPFVDTVLGAKWHEAAPVVAVLAMAMPFLTLQILFTPATTALGHARIQVISAAAGAIIMPIAFMIGIHGGVIGLAWAWIGGMPLLLGFTAAIAMPVLGTSALSIARAIRPPLVAATGMVVAVALIDRALIGYTAPARLTILVASGAIVYAGLIWTVARAALIELLALVRPGWAARLNRSA